MPCQFLQASLLTFPVKSNCTSSRVYTVIQKERKQGGGGKKVMLEKKKITPRERREEGREGGKKGRRERDLPAQLSNISASLSTIHNCTHYTFYCFICI